MNILILGGFLGSGKTSVLLQLAKYLVEREKEHPSDIKVAIIENEIGKVGIDDKILQDVGFNVSNLFSGCACCSLNVEMISSIKNIQEELNPKWIIIESTGVAYPGSIQKSILDYAGINAFIITLIDAKRWKRLEVATPTLVTGQLEDANIVLINKIDTVDEEELKLVNDRVLFYNNSVMIYKISAIENIPEDILNSIYLKMQM